MDNLDNYAVISIFVVLGIVYVGGAILGSRLLGTTGRDSKYKHVSIECGVLPFGSARIQFKIGYYLFALVFMIFDVEALFLFPCVVVYRAIVENSALADAGNTAAQASIAASGLGATQVMIELLAFVAILGLGLLFAWKKGILEWE